MYLAIEFQGNWSDQWKNMSDEDYEKLKQVLPGLPPEKPTYDPSGTFILTDENIEIITNAKLQFVLSREGKAQAVGTMLVKLQGRIDDIERAVTKKNFQEGNVVQIAIPDIGLMYIDEVKVLTDCCTDDLQEWLNEGWRILAVCPPNAQRRPDYVIGRRKPKDN